MGGSDFFLREIKKYFSKDFGVGGSDFCFSLEKNVSLRILVLEGKHFFPLRKIYVRNLVQEGQQVVLSVCCLDQSEM